jgi:hypothetical protein
MIGELCAIQGQIETLIQRTAKLLLSVSDEVITAILGSTSIRINSDIWIKICRERINDPKLLKIAEEAHKSTKTISEGRSDFVHASFESEHRSVIAWFDGIVPASRRIITTPVAIRVKNRNKTDMTELKKVLDEAARLSRMLAHIEHILKNEPQSSPWLGKF